MLCTPPPDIYYPAIIRTRRGAGAFICLRCRGRFGLISTWAAVRVEQMKVFAPAPQLNGSPQKRVLKAW
jgi:hypothetical protein